MSAVPVLVAEGIGKRFGGFTALDDVNVTFERGHLTAIIGPERCRQEHILLASVRHRRTDQGPHSL